VTVHASEIADGAGSPLASDDPFSFKVDSPPTDIQLSNSSIAENQPSGTDIGSLTTTDADAGDTASYVLADTGCGGASNDNGSFQIGGLNNDSLQSAASFDYEKDNSYTVCVRTTDGSALSFDKQFTISVTNVNEAPTDISLDNQNIDENKVSGSLVGNLAPVGDPDSGETYTFTLLTSGCSGSYPDSSSFQLSGAQLQSAVSFNYEVKNSYTICVHVDDPGSPHLSFEKQVTIAINDVNDAPLDGNESVTAVGNTLLEYGSVPSPSSAAKKVLSGNLLSNATDEDQPPQTLSISASDVSSAQGGDVSVSSSGAFSYVPKAGFTGTDTFHYTVSDGNGASASPSTVTITVASRVWYVKNNATAGGTGRSTDPFTALAAANTAANATGDITYVYKGDGSTTGLTGGFSLLASQKLLGEPVNLVIGADTLATGTPANRPSLSGTVALASGSRVEGVDIAGSAGAAIAGTNTGGSDVTNVNLSGGAGGVALTGAAAGTFNFTNFTITTTGGTGFLVNPAVAATPTLNVGSGSTENVSATSGPAVDVRNANGSSSLAFHAVSSTNSSGNGINLDSNGAATFSASSGSITGAGGTAVVINGGSGNVTYPGTLGNGSGNTAAITGRTGGSISLSGDINDTNDAGGGISMSSNSGGSTAFSGSTKTLNTGASAAFSSTGSGQTITFSGGGLTIATTSGAGFSATGGGTVNVTGSANTIDTTTGTALNVSSTTIGASGLTFQSISSNGAADGINLNTTGSTGGLTVSGTGTAGTGGTIQNSTDSGVLATSTKTPSLSWMSIKNNGNTVNEGGVRLTNVSGTGGITSSTVTGGYEDNVYIKNDTTTATFMVQGPSCSITNNSSVSGNNGINILAATSADLTATVNNCSFSGNRAVTIGADSADNSTLNVTITNNTITQGSPNHGNQGIQVSDAASGNVTFLVDGNKIGTPDGTTASPLMSTGINIFNGSAANAVMAGRVSNNTVLNDPSSAPGSSNGFGIRVFNSNLAQIRARVLSNTVKNVSADYGILAESSGATAAPSAPHGRLDVDIESNNVSVGSGALDDIRVQSRNFNTVCAKIASNTTNSGATLAGFFGIFIRQANSAAFLLDGWNGVGTPEAYVLTQNPAGGTTGSAGTSTGVAPNTCSFTGAP